MRRISERGQRRSKAAEAFFGAHDGAELHGAFGEIGDLKSGGAGSSRVSFRAGCG